LSIDSELDEILAEIGREHRSIGAPERLEHLLRTAAGGTNLAIRRPRYRLAWTFAVAVILLAALASAGVMWQMRRSQQPQNRQVRSVPVPQVKPEPTLPPARVTGLQDVPSKSAPVKRAGTDRAGRRERSPQPATWNSLAEFVPLPVSEGLPPAMELSVIRLRLRGSDLQQYGLEAPADAIAQTMLAEFVVGEDGLPRAIRIVQ
jgi:hypothetical protein